MPGFYKKPKKIKKPGYQEEKLKLACSLMTLET